MLKNSTMHICPLKHDHLRELLSLRNDPDTAYYLTSVIPINSLMQEAWYEKTSVDPTKMYLAILSPKNIFWGLVRCDEWDKVNRSIRIGVDILPKYRRKGYAMSAYGLMLSYLFNDCGLHRIWLLVASYNTSAMALYKKLGFVDEGAMRQALFRDGTFHDYIVMSMLDYEYQKTKK